MFKNLVGILIVSLVSISPVMADTPIFYGEEIVVTALRVPRLKSTVPWHTKVITRKEIEESTALNLGDVVRQVSGLAVKSTGGLGSQISARLRGTNSQQVLVLLNGSRINSPSLGTFDLGDILLADVERIEVVKGPMSPAYGADAVGGVINIITRRTTEKPGFHYAVKYGEHNTLDYSILIPGRNFFAAIEGLSSNGFRDNGHYFANDYHVRFFGKSGKADIEGGIKKYQGEKGSPGSLDFLTPQARQKDDNLFYDLSYDLKGAGFKVTAAQSILDQKYENPSWGLVSTHKTITSNYLVQKEFGVFPLQDWLIGAELRNDNSQSSNSGSHQLTNKAVFVQDEIQVTDVAKIVLGGREDVPSAFNHHFSPRVGVVLALLPDLTYKMSWGESFKAPTIDDLYWSRTTEPGWPTGVITTEGNPNLSPETSKSIDFTLEKKLGEGDTARLSLYQSEINDMIRWANTSTSTIDAYWTPQNINNAAIAGVEFEIEKQINANFSGFVNLSYQDARDKATDNFLDYDPQAQGNFGLTYQDNAGFTSNTVITYVGERYADLANFTKLPAYTVVDLALIKSFGSWSARLDITNLFNTSYGESYGFTDVYPMPGRRYNIGVSWII
jgi:outer membrane cobalamin receptor